jgi:tRNA nucleotidyltransferase (CCA-adding enzyme)
LLDPWIKPGTTIEPPLSALEPERADALGLTDEERTWALPLARIACLADAEALQRLCSSRALQKRAALLRQHWLQLAGGLPQSLPEAERFALHRSLEADLPALLLLLPPSPELTALLNRWRDASDVLCHPRPPCSGLQLQSWLGLSPGPRLGALLLHLSQERAFGRLAGDADAAAVISTARPWLARS